MSVSVKLPVFEGPLDLLLHLVKANKVKIWDIPITQIAQQYWEYLQWMQALDINLAGEFLVMAATLMEIKSRMLLPRPVPVSREDEPEDPRKPLACQLAQYQQFQRVAEWLGEQEIQSRCTFPRGFFPEAEPKLSPLLIPEDALQVLVKALRELLQERSAYIPVARVQPYRITLRQQMARVYNLLWNAGGSLPFLHLFQPGASRVEVVITFLAILELLRQGRISILREDPLHLGVLLPSPWENPT